MSDASTSLDEDTDNSIDEEEDNMDNDNDRGDTSTSTSNGHGSDKNIDDANRDETPTSHDDDDSSTNSTSSSDDVDSSERLPLHMKEMLITELIRFDEMSKRVDDLQALISHDIPESDMASFSRLFGGQDYIRDCKRGLLKHVFSNFNEERYKELERIGKERGVNDFTELAIKLGFADQVKTLFEISGNKSITSDKAAAGNNNGDGSSLGNSAAGRDGGSSIQQQQQNNIMRRTSLDQEQDDDDDDDATPQREKRVRSPRSSDSSSSDINRLTQHCSSSSSHKEGRSDQGLRRRLRRRRLNNGTESPRQESEGGGALALENARLQKELVKHQKTIDKLAKEKNSVATMKASLKKQQQELAKEKNQLNKETAKAVEDTKAESDQLAKEREEFEQQKEKSEEMLKVEMLRSEGNDTIDKISSSLDIEPVVLASFKLSEMVVHKIMTAMDPHRPNLRQIPLLTLDLISIQQGIAQYKKMHLKHITKEKLQSLDTLIGINKKESIASTLSLIEKKADERDMALNEQPSPFSDQLSDLNSALNKFRTGEADWTSKAIPSSSDMSSFFPFDQATENLLLNCLNCSLMVFIEEGLTLKQMFMHHGSVSIERVRKVFIAVKGESVPFNENMLVLDFREEALLPALHSNDQQLRRMAIQVNMDLANNLTDLRMSGRKEIVHPVLKTVQKKRLDGSVSECNDDEDYCVDAKQAPKRRQRMVCLWHNLSASNPIQLLLPNDLFSEGFFRSILLNSSTFCKDKCNFNMMPDFFFVEGYDKSKLVKDIGDKMKKFRFQREKVVIVDRDDADVLKSLKSLFG